MNEMKNVSKLDFPNNHTGPSLVAYIIMNGIFTASFLVNLPAILIIVWIIAKRQKIKNMHLLSLGITDCIVGLSSLFILETFYRTDKTFTYYDCWVRYYLFSVSFVASMLHVLTICVQRIRIILCITSIQNLQARRMDHLYICISWLISVVVNTIPFGLWSNQRPLRACSMDTLVYGNEHVFHYFIGIVYSVSVGMVVSTLWVLFGLLCMRAKTSPNKKWSPRDRRICVTVCIIAVLFLVTTTPLACITIGNELLVHNHSGKRWQRLPCAILSVLNSAINPFIYLFRVKEFRTIMRKMMYCNKKNCSSF